jgi:hypothetical protein
VVDSRVNKRAGFRQETDGRWEFMFTPAAWRAVCGARHATRVAGILWERKLLLGVKEERPPEGRIKIRCDDSVPIRGTVRTRIGQDASAYIAFRLKSWGTKSSNTSPFPCASLRTGLAISD